VEVINTATLVCMVCQKKKTALWKLKESGEKQVHDPRCICPANVWLLSQICCHKRFESRS